jgi:carboxypeptidase Q
VSAETALERTSILAYAQTATGLADDWATLRGRPDGRQPGENAVSIPRSAALLAVTLVVSTLLGNPAAQSPRAPASPPLQPNAVSAAGTNEPVDLDAIFKIKDEGLERSQVMDTLWYLTEVHGPRLTNSPNIRAAAAWTIQKMTEWGLSHPRLETWGPFGRGWANDKFTANVITPQPFPLIAFTRAWTPGTNGAVTADAILAIVDRADDFSKWQGKLAGKIVLAARPTTVNALFTGPGRRYTDQDLIDLQTQPINANRGRGGAPANAPAAPNFGRERMRFFAREGAVAVLEPGTGRNDHGSVLVGGFTQGRDASEPPTAAQVVVASEHYNRIARLLERGMPVSIELNVQNRFIADTLDSFNVVAEIPGTDKADEVVMLGAHFDSWHAGTGATDNAAGSAAMMEAMRILKATGLRLRRTVRLALWTGEEQGYFGSRAYVKDHFGDRETIQLKPEHAKLSGYFNLDNGTGAIRGVYLQGNEAIRPVFAAWMEPLRNLGMTTLTIRGTGGTDHLSFDDVGLPGFQFVQDPVEYSTYTHHTNMDVYDRIQAQDMMKNAVIIASFVYHAANRETLLPRKALPRPRPPQ